MGRAKAALNAIAAHPTKRAVLITGPLGEGKSITLRQIASDLARTDSALQVFWREPGGTLDLEALKRLPQNGTRYLLVSDEADLIASQLVALRTALSARSDIVLLLASHERDWRNAGAFANLGALVDVVALAGLTASDANRIAAAWWADGAPGLAKLANVADQIAVAGVLQASADSTTDTGGTLFGAVVQTRFGGELQQRIGDLVQRMDNYEPLTKWTLGDAFLMIASVHASRRSSLDEALSARLLCATLELEESISSGLPRPYPAWQRGRGG